MATLTRKPRELVDYLLNAECDASRAPDERRVMREERMRLQAAIDSDDRPRIARVRDEVIATIQSWDGEGDGCPEFSSQDVVRAVKRHPEYVARGPNYTCHVDVTDGPPVYTDVMSADIRATYDDNRSQSYKIGSAKIVRQGSELVCTRISWSQ